MWLDWVGGRGFLRLPSKRRSGGWRVGERVGGIGVAYVKAHTRTKRNAQETWLAKTQNRHGCFRVRKPKSWWSNNARQRIILLDQRRYKAMVSSLINSFTNYVQIHNCYSYDRESSHVTYKFITATAITENGILVWWISSHYYLSIL
jgi:hypothetical protein